MTTFKKGDKVRRISGSTGFVMTHGAVYEVAAVSSYGNLELVGREAYGFAWYADKFELVQEQPREFRYALTTGDLGSPKFDSLVAIEEYLLTNAASGGEIPIVEIVPVKTVKVTRVLEEVKA